MSSWQGTEKFDYRRKRMLLSIFRTLHILKMLLAAQVLTRIVILPLSTHFVEMFSQRVGRRCPVKASPASLLINTSREFDLCKATSAAARAAGIARLTDRTITHTYRKKEDTKKNLWKKEQAHERSDCQRGRQRCGPLSPSAIEAGKLATTLQSFVLEIFLLLVTSSMYIKLFM